MARCPLAEWKPLGDDPTHQPLMSKYDLVIIHTMVGTLAGTDAYFRQGGYVGVESHFGTGYIGGKVTAYQWGDTARTADANLDANPRAVSIENADTGSPFPAWKDSDVPPFTDDQAELIAQITAWACRTHDIPAVLVLDSLPGSRGIGYHRQGIDPWRVSGGEKWSDSTGKVCPGDKRIAQITGTIIPRVQAILKGGNDMPHFPDVSQGIGELHGLHAHGWSVEEDFAAWAKAHPKVGPFQGGVTALQTALPIIKAASDELEAWLKTQQGG